MTNYRYSVVISQQALGLEGYCNTSSLFREPPVMFDYAPLALVNLFGSSGQYNYLTGLC